MNRQTPDTDEAAFGTGRVSVDFARRLERERDEAREALEHITEYGTEEINAAVELRQKLASALVKRDEALEALMQIEDLFIDGTDIYADREKMGSIAREALRERNE